MIDAQIVMNSARLVSLLLRIGLAVVFLYAAVASWFDPNSWVGFFPEFLTAVIPARVLLTGFAGFQVLLALWLLSGIKVVWSALLASATIFAIVITNLGIIDIVFRDVAIFFAGLALVVLHKKRKGGDTI